MSAYSDVLPRDGVESVVTIGKFDGVHIGHQAVLRALRATAKGRRVVAVTFDRHPAELFNPVAAPKPLLSIHQKIEALQHAGAELVIVLPFTHETASISAEKFVSQVLVEGLSARHVVVGADFRYGAGGKGDVHSLALAGAVAGFSVDTVDDVCDTLGSPKVSSTTVREALSRGEVERAAELLGRTHRMRGVVVHGHQRGRDLGYPTVNLEENAEGFVPAAGVYAGILTVNGVRYCAGISVGKNPTFSDVTRLQVEAHGLDAEFDAYGHVAEIEFTHRIRDLTAFASVDELILAIHQDITDIRKLVARGDLRI